VTGRNYAQAVVAAGGLPLLAPTVDAALAPAYLARADALLLTGGVDVDPAHFGEPPRPGLGRVDGQRDAFELALYRAFRVAGRPILGVCRGIQLINVAEGGTLHQHLPDVAGLFQHRQVDLGGAPSHAVQLERRSRLAMAYGTTDIRVNSYHHQGLDAVPDGLRAVGSSGDGLIEAVEGIGGGLLVGVQWHPEMSWRDHPSSLAPFRLLVEAARSAA